MRIGELIAHAAHKSGMCNTVDQTVGAYSISKVPADVKAFALAALNRVYEWVWRQYPHRDARILNLAVTVAQAEVVLPDEVEAIRSLRISNQALFPLNEVVLADAGGWDQLTSSAVPGRYVNLSDAPVQAQPETPAVLLMNCDNDCTVYVRGKNANGVQINEEVSVSAGVQAVSTNVFSEIISISKGKTESRLQVSKPYPNSTAYPKSITVSGAGEEAANGEYILDVFSTNGLDGITRPYYDKATNTNEDGLVVGDIGRHNFYLWPSGGAEKNFWRIKRRTVEETAGEYLFGIDEILYTNPSEAATPPVNGWGFTSWRANPDTVIGALPVPTVTPSLEETLPRTIIVSGSGVERLDGEYGLFVTIDSESWSTGDVPAGLVDSFWFNGGVDKNCSPVLYNTTQSYAKWTHPALGIIITTIADVGAESPDNYFMAQDYPDTVTVSDSGIGADGEFALSGFIPHYNVPSYGGLGDSRIIPSSYGEEHFHPDGKKISREWVLVSPNGIDYLRNTSVDDVILYAPNYYEILNDVPPKTGWRIGGSPDPSSVSLSYTIPEKKFIGKGDWSGTITFIETAYEGEERELSVSGGARAWTNGYYQLYKVSSETELWIFSLVGQNVAVRSITSSAELPPKDGWDEAAMSVDYKISTNIASIAPWAERGEFRRIRMVPAPTKEVTIYVDAIRRFEEITSYNDTLLLPTCENSIFCHLLAELYEMDGNEQKAGTERQKADEELGAALKFDEGIDREDFRTFPADGMFGDDCGSYSDYKTM